MELGFLIDQRKCIGCHACTVACKSENEVPVGNFRTWVKYVEKGSFPTVRRHFTVLRCNHCDAAPCVEICPVNALSKREDKIVDLDRDLCIGCRSCMQACPYDALYLNEDTGVAEKCHYCAHRTERGLEPACVVVCPEEAIVSGDVADPKSRIAQTIDELPTSQRKLEKGTRPRVWYVDALEEALDPLATRQPESWLWADRTRELEPQARGPEDPSEPITTLNVDHQPVWGWHIWTYLLTKNIAAGAGMLAPFAALLGLEAGVWPELVALFFLAVTGALLVHDLGRPERFLKILTHPNPKSWLVIGTWILTAFGGLTTLACVLSWAELPGLELVRWLNLPLAVMTSGYSAFLFAQCRGRDLWLEQGLFATLVARAALCGAAFGVLLAPAKGATGMLGALSVIATINAILALRESRHEPEGESARRAREVFGRVRYRRAIAAFAQIAVAGGALIAIEHPGGGLALRCLLAGAILLLLFRLERAWIRAGQAIPIS